MNAIQNFVEESVYRIVDIDGYRAMMAMDNDSMAMSLMSLAAPDELVVPYLPTMLSFLVFNCDPKEVVLLGLGGGQQAKYIHSRMTGTHLAAVETDPVLVKLARTYFHLPPDDERMSVVVGDGGDYIKNCTEPCDVILSDGYDRTFDMMDSIVSEEFYRNCHSKLRDNGIMVVNLFHREDAWLNTQLQMLNRIFGYSFVVNVSYGQAVLFLFKRRPHIDLEEIGQRAAIMERHFNLRLPDFVQKLAMACRS